MGVAAEGSYEQEAAVVEEDEEMEREDERGVAKRPDLNELDRRILRSRSRLVGIDQPQRRISTKSNSSCFMFWDTVMLQLGDNNGQATASMNLSNACKALGDVANAIEHMRQRRTCASPRCLEQTTVMPSGHLDRWKHCVGAAKG
jgi:hypothetical protein